jgi:hypothetical protein
MLIGRPATTTVATVAKKIDLVISIRMNAGNKKVLRILLYPSSEAGLPDGTFSNEKSQLG